MRQTGSRTAWLWAGLLALWLLGSLRVFMLWSQHPLEAYANSYDQTRYMSCFGIEPVRTPEAAKQRNSPQAPFANFRFSADVEPICYWSSELAFTATTAALWKVAELLGGSPHHDVRWIGVLRWLVVLLISLALARAWIARGQPLFALANTALVPLLFADPGNTLYLDTFYAEFTALTAACLLVALVLLWRDTEMRGWRWGLLAFAAFLLAISKIQHLLLPLALALAVLLLDAWRGRRLAWRGVALLFGAICGLWLQVVQLHRSDPLIETIDQYNRADVVFTALLPFADDRVALLDTLHIDPACVRYSGFRAWQFPDLPERVCLGLADFSRAAQLRVLVTEPRLTLRMLGHGVLALDPWVAGNVGQIEGGEFAQIPRLVSVGRLLQAVPIVQILLLALPLLAWIALAWRARASRGSLALDFCSLTVLTMLATFAVTILGDGLADVAKQGHLVINVALAWFVCTTVILIGKFGRALQA